MLLCEIVETAIPLLLEIQCLKVVVLSSKIQENVLACASGMASSRLCIFSNMSVLSTRRQASTMQRSPAIFFISAANVAAFGEASIVRAILPWMVGKIVSMAASLSARCLSTSCVKSFSECNNAEQDVLNVR